MNGTLIAWELAVAMVGSEIMAGHHYGFKSGEWGEIVGIQHVPMATGHRLCFQVLWPDGHHDLWPVNDAQADYRFRGTPWATELGQMAGQTR